MFATVGSLVAIWLGAQTRDEGTQQGLLERVKKLEEQLVFIQDETATVPAGQVIAYAGELPEALTKPEDHKLRDWERSSGWLLCDGRLFKCSGQFKQLYLAIGIANGGVKGEEFHIPDYRSLFLRGAAGNSHLDASTEQREHIEDIEKRTASKIGGGTGNQVGSRQRSAFESHSHVVGNKVSFFEVNGGLHEITTNPGDKYRDRGQHRTENTGGHETRPENVYVHYLIRWRGPAIAGTGP